MEMATDADQQLETEENKSKWEVLREINWNKDCIICLGKWNTECKQYLIFKKRRYKETERKEDKVFKM